MAGADPNIGLKEDFRRPIHVAAEKGHRECVEALLKYALDFDLEGRTSPVTLATDHDFTDIATLLKDYDKSKVTKGKKRSSGLFGCFTDLLPKDILSRSNAPTDKPASRPSEGATANTPGDAAEVTSSGDVTEDATDKKDADVKEKKTEEIRRRRSNIQGPCTYYDFAKRFEKQLDLPGDVTQY